MRKGKSPTSGQRRGPLGRASALALVRWPLVGTAKSLLEVSVRSFITQEPRLCNRRANNGAMSVIRTMVRELLMATSPIVCLARQRAEADDDSNEIQRGLS